MLSETHPNDRSNSLLELPAILDLKAAAPLATAILALRGHELAIDGSCVQRLGAQCLQVLLSAAATWRSDEVSLSFTNLSAEFLEGLELLGIERADLMDQDFI